MPPPKQISRFKNILISLSPQLPVHQSIAVTEQNICSFNRFSYSKTELGINSNKTREIFYMKLNMEKTATKQEKYFTYSPDMNKTTIKILPHKQSQISIKYTVNKQQQCT